ncbi:HTH domain-containing protein [Haloferax gibbonsii]|uniref:HTH domain-containing protein n=1 Tax=Haloferax gibbonsii TaxID=35746 RepID=UPI000B00604F|nr:HTH domain-containing protein [Haloferax gibbonsii]
MSTPGLTLSCQVPIDPDSTATLQDSPPSTVWAELSEGLVEPFTSAIRGYLAGVHPGQRPLAVAELLKGHDKETLMYASVWSSLANGTDSDTYRTAQDLFMSLGERGSAPVAVDAGLDAVATAVAPILEATAPTPTVAITIDRTFRDRRADQRRRVLGVVATLASVCDVRLVGSPLMLRWVAQKHHANLPGDVRDQCSFSPTRDGPIDEVVVAARDTLDHSGSTVTILRAIADTDSETRTYSALTSILPISRSTVRNHLSTLRNLHLVSEGFRIGGEAAVELTKAGRAFVDTLDAEIGRQETIEKSVCQTGKSVGHPCNHAGKHEEALPAGDPTAADDEAPPLRRHHEIEYLSRREHAAAAATAPADGVSVTAYPAERRQGRLNGGWSYNSVRDEVVVSAEFVNVLPWRVTLARLLTDWRLWEHVLDEDRLGDSIGDLVDEHKDILRGMRCLGYLPDSIETVTEYRDALVDAREGLLEMTQKLYHEEYDLTEEEFRGVICREGLGLAGTAMHLLDLADIDVVIEMRLPTYARDFDEDRRQTLVETIATETTVFSRYGHHVARRHLYEHRDKKRQQAFSPTIDAEDPFGDLIPSYSVVGAFGSKQTSFATALRKTLTNPAELHENAPEFAIPVTVVTDTKHDRELTAAAARRVLGDKNLTLTRETLSVLTAFATTPYDVADALSQLSPESITRDLRVDEVRYALAHLDTARVLPDATPTVRAALSTLLAADVPLSRQELADQADVTTRSIRSHLDSLLGTGVVEETPEGIRLALSFHTDDERYTAVLPRLVTDELHLARDAVYEALEYVDVDDQLVWDTWAELPPSGVPDVDRLSERFEWMKWLLPTLRALSEQPCREQQYRTYFGATLEQISLEASTKSTDSLSRESGYVSA